MTDYSCLSNPTLAKVLSLNNNQLSTLRRVMKSPLVRDLRWREVKKLLYALQGTVTHVDGSLVSVNFSCRVASFHIPHGGESFSQNGVKAIQRLLLQVL
jgi:hypothetical protein